MIRCSFVEPLMMESFSYNSEGKSIPYYEEVDFTVDVFAKSRKVFPGWDRECANSSQFIDLDLSELPRKPFLGTCSTTAMLYGGEIGADASKMLATTLNCFNASDLSLDSGSNHTNSSKDSNSPDPFQFDLKLGSLVDGREGKDVEFSNESFRFDSAGVAPLAKRARGMSSRAQSPPVCQVYGCNKDLSSSKNYHKKHKVCDAHSKSSKVIVKGIEQRFCQQCSRFHLLSEFDDGKRSCRKRLAGHNERRRKPQLGALNLKPDKLLQISQGTEFLGTSLGKRNIFLSNTPQGNIHNPESGVANGYTNIKLEEKSAFGSQLPIPMAYEPLLLNSFLHLGGTGRLCGTGIPPSTTESTIFGTGSYFDELAGFSNSSCALSLLSAESQGLSSFTENAVTKPLVSKTGSAYHMDASYMHLRLGAKYVADGSSGIDAVTINTIDPFVGYNTALAADLRVNVDGFTQESNFSNSKYHVSTEHESTMDLLQLSSHLQRVEQQRTIIQAKLETKDFTSCNFTYES